MDGSLADCNNANGPCNLAVYKRQAEEGKNEDRPQSTARCVHRGRSGADSRGRGECHGDDGP